MIVPEFTTAGGVTVSTAVLAALNAGVTVMAEVSVTLQLPVPEHPPPLQPAKEYPVAAVAVRVT